MDAEKYKVDLQPPKGKAFNWEKFISNFDDDDKFFHVTCHIDSNLRAKIARGEFIDLEKLVPKDKFGGGGNIDSRRSDENRIELVSRGGQTYFKSVRDNQINGLRKWEQAFRIYAAIYTEANPGRATEIWQYIHTINVAASSYQWDNVAYYDLTFRQLMAYKPHRSWSKLYNQVWNLAMRDPLLKNSSHGTGSSVSQSSDRKKSWRDYCCWKFNKNRCQSLKCEFDHRCTYCGGWNHGFYNCHKRMKRESSKGKGDHSEGDYHAQHSQNNQHKSYKK